jgi:hypothetical protein
LQSDDQSCECFCAVGAGSDLVEKAERQFAKVRLEGPPQKDVANFRIAYVDVGFRSLIEINPLIMRIRKEGKHRSHDSDNSSPQCHPPRAFRYQPSKISSIFPITSPSTTAVPLNKPAGQERLNAPNGTGRRLITATQTSKATNNDKRRRRCRWTAAINGVISPGQPVTLPREASRPAKGCRRKRGTPRGTAQNWGTTMPNMNTERRIRRGNRKISSGTKR